MARNTGRDRTWSTALKLAYAKRDETWRTFRTISAKDVEDELADPPSRRTIRDVLISMAEAGVLEAVGQNGEYEWRDPSEWDGETVEKTEPEGT